METLSRLTVAMALIFAAPVFADDAHHPEEAGVAAAPAKAAPAAPATIKQMQGNVKEMQAQLDRLGKAKTDEERQKVVAEHMRTMMENMNLAKGMQAGMMDCESMHGGMMMKHGAVADPSVPAPDRLRQLERRMERMERMMSRRDAAGAPAPAK